MSQIVHALIEHQLTPEEVISLPRSLQLSLNNHIAGQWIWTIPNLDKKLLSNIWNRKPDYFIHNSWSIEDLALLQKGKMTIEPISPTIIKFDNILSWYSYNRSEALCNDFNILANEIKALVKGLDILMIPDLGSLTISDENQLSVDDYRIFFLASRHKFHIHKR